MSLDFLVIGAQKAGTTWVDAVLRQHSDVLLPQGLKEVHYFNVARNVARGPEWYLGHFDFDTPHRIAGECTPNYFWADTSEREKCQSGLTRDIVREVETLLPDVRFVMCLRDPVDRAVSAYFHHLRQGRVDPRHDFSDVMNEYGILSMGHYARHLRRWLEWFPRERFHFIVYESDVKDPVAIPGTLTRLADHLGIAPWEEVSNPVVNAREPALVTWMRRRTVLGSSPVGRQALRAMSHLPLDVFNARFRTGIGETNLAWLRDLYAGPNEELASLIGRDLPWSSREALHLAPLRATA